MKVLSVLFSVSLLSANVFAGEKPPVQAPGDSSATKYQYACDVTINNSGDWEMDEDSCDIKVKTNVTSGRDGSDQNQAGPGEQI